MRSLEETQHDLLIYTIQLCYLAIRLRWPFTAKLMKDEQRDLRYAERKLKIASGKMIGRKGFTAREGGSDVMNSSQTPEDADR